MKKRLISFLLATALMVSGIMLPANSNAQKTVAKEPDSFATSTMDFELKYVDQAPTPSPSTYKRAQATTYFSGSTEAKDFLTDCSTDYAFWELEKRTNASALQTLYQKIKTALLDAYLTDKSVSLQHIGPPNDGYDLYILETISYTGLDVKENELMEVYQRVLSDHPLFFFTAGTIFYSSSDIFIIMEDDFVSGSVRQSYISQISDMIHSFELTVEGAKGNYDLAQKVQDRIIDEADYAYVNNGHGLIPVSTPFTHNIVGYVKDGKVVCDGYTKTFSAILNYFDINCIIVTGWGNVKNGEATSPSDSHAWNLVQLDDGNYYFTDVTWDDHDGSETDYFAKGTNSFYETHSVTKKDNYDDLFTLILELPDIPETDYHSSEEGFYKTEDPTFTPKEGYSYTWNPDQKILTFYGNGAIETNTAYSENSWYVFAKNAKKLVITEGITSIEQRAFYNFTALQTVILPKGITAFGSELFAKCKSLKTIENHSTTTLSLEDADAYDTSKLVYWKDKATGKYVSEITNGTVTSVYFGKKKVMGNTFTVDNIQYKICSDINVLTLDELSQNMVCADVEATPLSGICTVPSTISYENWNYRIVRINVQKPAAPSSLTAKLYGHDDIHVSWKKAGNVAGYKISFKKSNSKSYTSLGETTNNYIKKANLSDNTSYTFKVTPYRTINGEVYEGPAKTIRIYTLKEIGKLKTLKGELYGYNDLKLSWKKTANTTRYNIYYKKASAKGYTYIGYTTSLAVRVPDLKDGTKYTFKVVPYASSKGSSCEGSGKTVSVYTLKKLSTPSVSKASSSKVKVKWKNIGGESGYQISRSTKKKGTNIVATYKTTSGTSKTLKTAKGKTYYYKVRAYKTVNGKKIYGPWSSVKAYKLK